MVDLNKDDRRSFLSPDGDKTYFIGSPNAEDIRGADWHYSKIYTKCLNEGIPTSAELMDILKKRGVIGEHYDRRVTELHSTLTDLVSKLNSAEDNTEKAEYAIKVSQAREALFQWNQRLNGPMSNTCEQIADDARLEYLTSCIIQNEDGSKAWADYPTFLTSSTQALTMRSRYEVMLYLQGYDSDFLDKTPEAMAMKEIEADIIKKASEITKMEDTTKEEIVEPIVEEDTLEIVEEPLKEKEKLKKKAKK